MTLSNIVFTRKEYDIIARSRGIKEPQNMATEELLNALSRYYSKRKVKDNHKKLLKMKLEKISKIQNISRNDLHKVTKLQDKSLDDLKKIAKLRRIKNYDNLSKEDLIYTLLRSESDLVESNYEKYMNNNTNDQIKSEINNIRIILARLGNIITKNVRKKIKNDLYEIEKKQRLTKTQKERIYNHLIELANALNKKEEYKYHNYDDLDYFGIKDIENLFINIDDSDYYKPILVNSSFKIIMNIMKSEEIRTKNYQ